jgi:mono/diheme cytochrome c family protein
LKPDPRLACLAAAAFWIAGCDQAMSIQPKRMPLQSSTFFADGRSSRSPVPGTVPQGGLRLDEHLYRGLSGGDFARTFPGTITEETLARGRERFNIFCSPCHGRTGGGHGTVVERGYRAPPSFHQDRLRQAPPGYLFDVVTRGQGAMPGYADQVPAQDRWAILAYIRALQLSQAAPEGDVPPEELRRLEALPP